MNAEDMKIVANTVKLLRFKAKQQAELANSETGDFHAGELAAYLSVLQLFSPNPHDDRGD